MKWICLLLLIVNIGYFGWTLDQRTRETVQVRASALSVPRDVPRLQLISELEQPPVRRMDTVATTTAESGTGTDADEPELVATLPDISTTLPESLIMPMRLAADACFSFGPFAERDHAQRLLNWLHAHDTQARLRRENVPEQPAAGGRDQLSWIYLAPQDGAAATLRDLRESGVQDVHLIDTGDLRNAISLGLFSSQAAVNRRLEELQDKGYQPIVIPYSESGEISWVDARLASSGTIDELMRVFPSGLNYLPVQCDRIALPQVNP